MTPSEIKKVLVDLDARANKRLGQHFLIDDHVLKTIVEAADIHPGERVLEIGPGLGVLTQALVERGAEVTTVERDRKFVEYLSVVPAKAGTHTELDSRGSTELTEVLRLPAGKAGRNDSQTKIIHADAAKLDWDELMAQPARRSLGHRRAKAAMATVREGGWKFVSNLPYSITSLALRKALWGKNPPSNIVVLVQREVAERAVAKNKKTSLLSLMVALASSSAKIIRRVPAGAFYPPPKVESAILHIVPMIVAERQKKWGINPDLVMQLAKKGFAHPRKKLFSNLGIGRPQGSPLPENIRAEDLSPEDWAALARSLTAQCL